jgi:hypothetical protein
MYIDQSNEHHKIKNFPGCNEQRHVKLFKLKLCFTFAYHSQTIHHPDIILKIEKAPLFSRGLFGNVQVSN